MIFAADFRDRVVHPVPVDFLAEVEGWISASTIPLHSFRPIPQPRRTTYTARIAMHGGDQARCDVVGEDIARPQARYVLLQAGDVRKTAT